MQSICNFYLKKTSSCSWISLAESSEFSVACEKQISSENSHGCRMSKSQTLRGIVLVVLLAEGEKFPRGSWKSGFIFSSLLSEVMCVRLGSGTESLLEAIYSTSAASHELPCLLVCWLKHWSCSLLPAARQYVCTCVCAQVLHGH